ncbi:MAG: glycine cleavage system protein R, partial [Shewanella sp.]
IGLGLTELAQEEQLVQSLYALGDDLVLDKLTR